MLIIARESANTRNTFSHCQKVAILFENTFSLISSASLDFRMENLSLVIQYLHEYHRDRFEKIIDLLKHRLPGIRHVESKTTEEGRVLLKFQDGAFEDPFLARYVSDGTIKMLAYLTLLYDPNPHPILFVEEP